MFHFLQRKQILSSHKCCSICFVTEAHSESYTIAIWSKAMKRTQCTLPHPANHENKFQLHVNDPVCLNSAWKCKHMYSTQPRSPAAHTPHIAQNMLQLQPKIHTPKVHLLTKDWHGERHYLPTNTSSSWKKSRALSANRSLLTSPSMSGRKTENSG